jgi:hypothetical protein
VKRLIPGTYTRPFTVSYTAKLGTPGSEIMEYICVENNQYGLQDVEGIFGTKIWR